MIKRIIKEYCNKYPLSDIHDIALNLSVQDLIRVYRYHLILKNYGFGVLYPEYLTVDRSYTLFLGEIYESMDSIKNKYTRQEFFHNIDTCYGLIAQRLLSEPALYEKNLPYILAQITNLVNRSQCTFVDLFAGIGGFHQAMHSIGYQCVFASELDKYARQSYEANYKDLAPNVFCNHYKRFNSDITNAELDEIPDFSVCCAGFPCQPFSIAGKRRGFEDTRGTLFFNIVNIVRDKIRRGFPPKVLFLENVKGLRSHDHGNTLATILQTLTQLGYAYKYDVLNAKYFGVPQNRERLFIVAWYRQLIHVDDFSFPYGIDQLGHTIFDKNEAKDNCIETHVSDIFETNVDSSYTISDRMWVGHQNRKERNRLAGKGFGYSLFKGDDVYCSTISARYWKDGSEILIDQSELNLNPRRLTPVEAGRLQGYRIIGNGWQSENAAHNQNNSNDNQEYQIVVSKKEAYHQFGNSVAIPVIKRIAKEIKRQLL